MFHFGAYRGIVFLNREGLWKEMSELSKYIGKMIKTYREKNGMTQDYLAEKLETSRQSISRYESGDRKANQDILFELAEIFGVTINDFFPEVNKKTNDTEPDNLLQEYYYYPYSISAGFPIVTDGVTMFEKISLPDVVMGKYAGEKNILIMKINGESMNRVIPDGSLIGIQSLNVNDLMDGDIVVYSHQNEYSVKQFYRRGRDVIFKPLSEDPTFTDYVVNENDQDLIIHGKVVIYIVEK